MQRLKTILKNKLSNATRIGVLGIGSDLRGDDAAGLTVALNLAAHLKKNKIKSLKVFLGRTAPENLTGQIKKFKPSHLIVIDAVDFRQAAGTVGIIDTYKDTGASFSTHRVPFEILRDYLYKAIACEIILIGIQPESLGFCKDLSPEVLKAVKDLSVKIQDIANKHKERYN